MMTIKILSTVLDAPDIVELEEFFWLNDEHGWAFGYGEDTEYSAYGLFPSDFVEMGTDYETKIVEFLEGKPHTCIPVSDFLKWMATHKTSQHGTRKS